MSSFQELVQWVHCLLQEGDTITKRKKLGILFCSLPLEREKSKNFSGFRVLG
jgi:hypothetical protein